ncbi:MAG: 4'-phosphopantetheinyl transferase, partial [Deltaproteobacteria bacterium]
MKVEITPWQQSPTELHLKDGELHLWRFELNSSKSELDGLRGILAADELIRADRLLDLQKKQQFIVARARLREILGHYQKIKPQEIKFQYNTHGKPDLSESLHSSVSFNLSHSGHWGTLAVVNKFA